MPISDSFSAERIGKDRKGRMHVHAKSTSARDKPPAWRRAVAALGLSEQAEFLAAHDFDAESFLELQDRVRRGAVSETSAIYTGRLEIPPREAIPDLPGRGAPAAEELASAGDAAFRRGEVAVVVIAGGMATRFGGGVKAAVDVVPGCSFLQAKLKDARETGRRANVEIPFCVMTSFATKDGIVRHILDRGLDGPDIHIFEQSASIRLTPEGEIFRGKDGEPSYYAPGHGDFFEAFRKCGLRDELAAKGVRYLFFSNVDNLGATLDPRIIGYHVRHGRDMTAEVTPNIGQDKAGCAVVADGRLRLMEGFRLPENAPPFPDLSINTFVFSVDALAREIPLVSYLVRKEVEGCPALQAERVTCEATEALDAEGNPLLSLACIRVPRSGRRGSFFDGRFYPVKEPADLERVREQLLETTRSQRP